MYYLALLVALAGLSVDAMPFLRQNGGCCLPDQMTMVEGLMIGKVHNGSAQVMLGNIFVAMDQNEQKILSNITLVQDNKVIALFVLQDFKSGVQYVVNGSRCSKSQLGEWVPKCIPQSAAYVGSSYFGHAGRINGVATDTYLYSESGITAYILVTQEEKCMPVTEVVYGSKDNVPFTSTLDFLNSTTTITDPSIFDVPSICTKANVPLVPQHQALGGSVLFR